MCASPTELADQALHRIRDGLRLRGAVLAILRPETETDVRSRLGADAENVHYLAHDEFYTGTAAARHDSHLAALGTLCARVGPVTTVTQCDPTPDQAAADPRGTRCLEAETLAEIDFARFPLHLHCLYAGYRNHRFLASAYRTHPIVDASNSGSRPSRRYRTPATRAAADPALAHLDRTADVHQARSWTPGLRSHLHDLATGAGLTGRRARDFTTAVHEAIRTASGPPRPDHWAPAVRLYLHDREHDVCCDVDAPALPPLRTHRLPPDPELTFLWLASHHSEHVSVTVHPLDTDHCRIRVRATRHASAAEAANTPTPTPPDSDPHDWRTNRRRRPRGSVTRTV